MLWLCMVLPVYVMPCDICGAYMGITPYDNQSSIQLLHRYRAFNGYYGSGHTHSWFPETKIIPANAVSPTGQPVMQNQLRHGGHDHGSTTPTYSDTDYEIYQVSELRVKYFIHQRIELNALVPFNTFNFLQSETKTHITGLGDITVYGAYHLVRKVEVATVQHRLVGALGIKLPTGNCHASMNEKRLPLLMQCGTGTTDVFVTLNYVTGWKKFGLNLASGGKICSKNAYGEQVLPSTTHYLNVFYKMKAGNWVFIPALQNYYEFTNGVFAQEGTNMNMLYSGIGVDAYYKNIGFTLSAQGKTWEKQEEGKIAATSRIAAGLSYNFNQTKYLLKTKTK